MEGTDGYIVNILLFLAAAVVGVPAFRYLGLSAVLGYLVAGLAIGPSGMQFFMVPQTITGIAELGVVMFLFVVGLELKPSTLLSMRRAILGLGAGQLLSATAMMAAVFVVLGYKPAASAVVALAFALSPTAIALQMLEERGALQSDYGNRTFAVLLFQDIAVVPVLALLPLLGPSSATPTDMPETLVHVLEAGAAILALVLAGRYFLNPFFRALARAGAREVMTAAALLVVLGAAHLMHHVGLSAALGAFMAGLLLAESDFRHQIEADIEPFRGLLLGLFFMSVGMSIDGAVVMRQAPLILATALAVIGAKFALVYALMRLTKAGHGTALRAAVLLAPVGEFAFVLLPLAAHFRLVPGPALSLLSAIVATTMFLGPVLVKALEAFLARKARKAAEAAARAAPEPEVNAGTGDVLVIGFGRFGQVVNQVLLAAGRSVTVIDTNVERIRAAARFGFTVYYGDGRRLDVLRAAGAEDARLIAVCVDGVETTSEIVELVRSEFPGARLFARAYDRVHAIDLMKHDVDYQLRETSESALVFGRAALVELGVSIADAEAIQADVRRRDHARLIRQRDEGADGGSDLVFAPNMRPEPLTQPTKKAKGLSGETQALIGADGDQS